jgi:hypothetical protein
MTVIAVCSAKGSPGATVTALAFTLTWTGRMILAECDPAGGDVAAGYLRELPLAGRGLAQLTASLHRRRIAQDLWGQLVDLDSGGTQRMTRFVLPGLSDPAQAAGLAAAWDQVAQLFHSLEETGAGYDVIADCGRLVTEHQPLAIITGADLVLVVLRLTLPSIRATYSALELLRQRHGIEHLGLVAVGDGDYPAKQVGLELRAPVVAAMPDDPATAAVLSTGGERHRGRLLRAAAHAEPGIRQMVAVARQARAQSRVGLAATIERGPDVA